jgi:hypothetical protein
MFESLSLCSIGSQKALKPCKLNIYRVFCFPKMSKICMFSQYVVSTSVSTFPRNKSAHQKACNFLTNNLFRG